MEGVGAFSFSFTAGKRPRESPHFANGLTSRLFGPHKGRTEGLKVPHRAWRDLFLGNSEPRTRVSGLVIRESPQRSTNSQLHFGPRKNEGIAEVSALTITQLTHEHQQNPRSLMRESHNEIWDDPANRFSHRVARLVIRRGSSDR